MGSSGQSASYEVSQTSNSLNDDSQFNTDEEESKADDSSSDVTESSEEKADQPPILEKGSTV